MFPDFYHSFLSAHFGCFVLQGIQHLKYLLALASQTFPIWTFSWGLRSVISISPTFLEGVPKLSSIFSYRYRARLLICPIWCPQEYFLLSPGLLPFDQSCGGASFGLLIAPKLPIFLRVLWGSRKDCSVTVRNIPVSLIPTFYFPSLVKENVLTGLFCSLPWYYYCSHLSLCYVRRKG